MRETSFPLHGGVYPGFRAKFRLASVDRLEFYGYLFSGLGVYAQIDMPEGAGADFPTKEILSSDFEFHHVIRYGCSVLCGCEVLL